MSAVPSTREPATRGEAARAAALYEAHSRRILGYCLRRLPSREEAEDAVQHTFMNAFRGLRQGVVPRSETAWLYKIAENVCRERRRSAWRRSRVELVQDPDGMAGLAVAPARAYDELAGLADALAELPPNQQRAILLREWQGLSYREIAGQLGLSEGAVETLLFRARRSLAHKLDRSRGRTWGSLGSAGAWGKSLLGGTAAKVAATAVVVAGIAAATPTVRHELRSSGRAAPSLPAAVEPVRAPDPRPAAAEPVRRTIKRTVRKGQVRGTVSRTGPRRTPAAGAQLVSDEPPAAPPSRTPPPPAVRVPPVQVPSPRQLPVRLPPPPPLPPVSVPGAPPLPPLLP